MQWQAPTPREPHRAWSDPPTESAAPNQTTRIQAIGESSLVVSETVLQPNTTWQLMVAVYERALGLNPAAHTAAVRAVNHSSFTTARLVVDGSGIPSSRVAGRFTSLHNLMCHGIDQNVDRHGIRLNRETLKEFS